MGPRVYPQVVLGLLLAIHVGFVFLCQRPNRNLFRTHYNWLKSNCSFYHKVRALGSLASRVTRDMATQRLHRGQRMIHGLLSLGFAIGLYTMFSTTELSNAERSCFIIGYAIILLSRFLGENLTLKRLDVVYSCLMFLMSLCAVLDGDSYTSHASRLIRILLGHWVVNFKLVAVQQMVFILAASARTLFTGEDTTFFLPFLLMELLTSYWQVVLVHEVEHLQMENIHFSVQVNSAKLEREGAQALLNLMCDAVVVLDEECRFKEEDPKFCNLLRMKNDFAKLQGKRLDEFIPAEGDCTRLADLLTTDATQPRMLQVQFCSVPGIRIELELYHTVQYDIYDKICHLISMNEAGEHMKDRRAQAEMDEFSIQPPEAENAASFPQLDFGAQHFKICGTNTAFDQIFGTPQEDAAVLEMMLEDDATGFADWFSAQERQIKSGSVETFPLVEDYGPATLVVGKRRRRRRYTVVFRVHFWDPKIANSATEDGSEGEYVVSAVIHSWRMVRPTVSALRGGTPVSFSRGELTPRSDTSSSTSTSMTSMMSKEEYTVANCQLGHTQLSL